MKLKRKELIYFSILTSDNKSLWRIEYFLKDSTENVSLRKTEGKIMNRLRNSFWEL